VGGWREAAGEGQPRSSVPQMSKLESPVGGRLPQC